MIERDLHLDNKSRASETKSRTEQTAKASDSKQHVPIVTFAALGIKFALSLSDLCVSSKGTSFAALGGIVASACWSAMTMFGWARFDQPPSRDELVKL